MYKSGITNTLAMVFNLLIATTFFSTSVFSSSNHTNELANVSIYEEKENIENMISNDDKVISGKNYIDSEKNINSENYINSENDGMSLVYTNNNFAEDISAKSAVLMEASTGKILYSKNENERVSPASVTKIMTLLLIFDAIHKGEIKLEDSVTTSEYAKSMGGSQVFLETGEVQSVETLIKCIVVSSGNDACVAMAEFIAGDEQCFVNKMNEKAKELGLINTNFVDCCGLTEDDNHFFSAKDVAIVSRELLINYPEITTYSSIWMENITHQTKKGAKEFGLANTNKLIKQYPYATGLKTGSTSKAKYCVTATARKNDMELIAVIMGANNHKIRFTEARKLLEYGYNNYKVYKDMNEEQIDDALVFDGIKKTVSVKIEKPFSCICDVNAKMEDFSKEIDLDSDICAPINKGDVLGSVKFFYKNNEVGSVKIIADEAVARANFISYVFEICDLITK